jgi:hypothetical protein
MRTFNLTTSTEKLPPDHFYLVRRVRKSANIKGKKLLSLEPVHHHHHHFICHICININQIKQHYMAGCQKAKAHHSWPPIVTKEIVSIQQYARVNKIYNLKYAIYIYNYTNIKFRVHRHIDCQYVTSNKKSCNIKACNSIQKNY